MTKGFIKFDATSEADWFEYNEMKFLIGPYYGHNFRKVLGANYNWADAEGITREGAKYFKDLPAIEANKKIYRLYADSLLLDWEGVTEGGKKLKYTPDAAFDLLVEYDDFAQFVIASAIDVRKKQLNIQDETVKN